jgi:hypothetical protein
VLPEQIVRQAVGVYHVDLPYGLLHLGEGNADLPRQGLAGTVPLGENGLLPVCRRLRHGDILQGFRLKSSDKTEVA